MVPAQSSKDFPRVTVLPPVPQTPPPSPEGEKNVIPTEISRSILENKHSGHGRSTKSLGSTHEIDPHKDPLTQTVDLQKSKTRKSDGSKESRERSVSPTPKFKSRSHERLPQKFLPLKKSDEAKKSDESKQARLKKSDDEKPKPLAPLKRGFHLPPSVFLENRTPVPPSIFLENWEPEPSQDPQGDVSELNAGANDQIQHNEVCPSPGRKFNLSASPRPGGEIEESALLNALAPLVNDKASNRETEFNTLHESMLLLSLKKMWANHHEIEPLTVEAATFKVLHKFFLNTEATLENPESKENVQKKILQQLLSPSLVIPNTFKRLDKLREEIWCPMSFEGVKTKWSAELFSTLEELRTAGCAHVVEIIEHLMHKNSKTTMKLLRQHHDTSKLDEDQKSIKKLVLGCFGRTEQEIEAALLKLKKLTSEAHIHELMKQIDVAIDTSHSLTMKAARLSSQRYLWKQSDDLCRFPLNRVALYEICRAWMMSKKCLFDSIKINGKPFMWKPENIDKEEEDLYLMLFEQLFKMLAEEGMPMGTMPIKEQVQLFYKTANEYYSPENKDAHNKKEAALNQVIPCLPLLRLTAQNSFMECFDYWDLLFPRLRTRGNTDKEFTMKPVANKNHCSIDIDSEKRSYSVTLSRSFLVTPLDNLNPALSIRIVWNVVPVVDDWEGVNKATEGSMAIIPGSFSNMRYYRPIMTILTNPDEVSKGTHADGRSLISLEALNVARKFSSYFG